MEQFDVVAWMVPVDSGLKKQQIMKILHYLPDESEIVPFEIHEQNSSAYGFATGEVIDEENGLEPIVDLLGSAVADWTAEASECTYVLPGSGRKAYIGCDYRTVLLTPK